MECPNKEAQNIFLRELARKGCGLAQREIEEMEKEKKRTRIYGN